MFQTSVDLMYGVISICIIIFTIFLVWIMYYIIQILKQGNEVIAEIRQKILEFHDLLTTIREKVFTSAKSITFIASEIGTIVDAVKRHTKSRNSKRSQSKKDEKEEENDED